MPFPLTFRLDRASRGARRVCLLIALLLSGFAPGSAGTGQAQEELRVLLREGDGGPVMEYTDAPNSLYRHLQSELVGHMRARGEMVERIRTESQWRARQQQVRATLMEVLGPFPERTPLDARVTGVLERPGYRVEKLVFESRPGNPVTAALFVPAELAAPAPAILHLSGHSPAAYRNEPYQRVILNLVRKGFIVLAMDPVGQGERVHYSDAELGQLGRHDVPGVQVYLTGGSLAREMIWDGIRAVDYLVSRPEVDPGRIGVTGRSGGGTQTAYLAAVDERIRAAAPGLYITSLARLWETRGPQDAEQHFVGGAAAGLDHADLLVVRAPRPTLLVTSTRDIFSIQGARETFAEARRAFAALGAPEMLRRVEGDTSHAYTPSMREAIYAFFQETLALPGDPADEPVSFLTAEELRSAPGGRATDLPGAATTYEINLREAERLRELRERAAVHDADYAARVVQAAREISGYRDPGDPADPIFTGRFHRDGYAIERYILEGEGDYPIPFLLLLPNGGGPHPAVVYLHPEGKAADAAPGGVMEKLVQQGFAVVAPDLVGRGETAPRDFLRGMESPRTRVLQWFGAVSLGRSITAIQAADLVGLVRAVRGHSRVAAQAFGGVAHGELAPVLLHAAAFDAAIGAVALIEPLSSYHALAATRLYDPRFIPNAVAGMLPAYDLPDLAAVLAPRPLLVVNAVDGTGSVLAEEPAADALRVAREGYERAGHTSRFRLVRRRSPGQVGDEIARWLADTN